MIGTIRRMGSESSAVRPRLLWLAAAPALAAASWWATLDGSGFSPRMILAGFALAVMVVAAFRHRVELRGDSIQVRGAFRSHPPLRLADLVEATIRWEGLLPRRVLNLYREERLAESFDVTWWWGDMRPLMREAMAHPAWPDGCMVSSSLARWSGTPAPNR